MRFPVSFLLLICINLAYGDYYGIKLGSLKNSEYGIDGTVWLANDTFIQITNFSVEKQQKQEISLIFSNGDKVEPVKQLYKVLNTTSGEYLVSIKRFFDKGVKNERIVAVLPKKSMDSWTHFGVVSGKNWKYLAAVKLDKVAPKPYCCLTNPKKTERGIIGSLYQAKTGPITILDAKTLVLKNFELEAHKAPDAWIFAGKGKSVRRSTGVKAFVIGRDTPNHHCSLRGHFKGESDMVVRLAEDQTVYDIDYLSIFCFQYDVDFGHLKIDLDPETQPLPAYIPPLQSVSALLNESNVAEECA